MNFDIDDWCATFKALPTEPMSEDLSRVFLACMLGGINRDVIEDLFIYKVINARADALGLEIEQSLIDFLTILCKSPGDATMFLSLLKNEAVQGNSANMENFTMIFPMGFPNQNELSTMWDLQKVQNAPLGNALDTNHWS